MPPKKKARIDVSQKTLGYDGYQLQLQTASGQQPVEQAGLSSVLYIYNMLIYSSRRVQWVF